VGLLDNAGVSYRNFGFWRFGAGTVVPTAPNLAAHTDPTYPGYDLKVSGQTRMDAYTKAFHDHVGWVRVDRGEQRVGVAGRAGHLDAGVAEQAGQPLSQQRRVLGEDHPHGSLATTVVPAPVGPHMVVRPPTATTRSRMPSRIGVGLRHETPVLRPSDGSASHVSGCAALANPPA
jgi:hypothetical protein